MNIALCYENVDPLRGGCQTYISDFARALVRDRHEVHLYASRWNASALPPGLVVQSLPRPRGPRFLRPWRFAASCEQALRQARHDVSLGFDKTWGQDVLYPQGGIHAASVAANLRKHSTAFVRFAAAIAKSIDPATRSFARLERRQHERPSTLIVNSEMVRRHAATHLRVDPASVHVVHAAIDTERFVATDRVAIRTALRRRWQVNDDVPVALFVAMNYRLKGIEPLLHAMCLVPREKAMRLVVVGNPRFSLYERRARSLGIADRVTFHGFCDNAREVYFASDLLVHPTFYDPCSLVALEALACGLPVVTSAFNGACELLHPPHDGLIVQNPHDHAELAAAITRFLDADVRRVASECARQSSLTWTFADHYRKMMAILEATAARKQARAA